MQNFQIIIILMVLISLSAPCYGGNSDSFVPWNFNNPGPEEKIGTSPSFSGHLLMQGVKIFSKYISRVDGDRCPMHPTCSAYSLQVIKKHGFFIGFMMTAGRLIHESNEMDYAPLVQVGDRCKFYDPVSDNDFWWYNSNNLDK
ncbi:MAG: membrane protein insertion efficiency factor YidD [Thermodesulfobacteriota bacterium]|nr:membrane protein insertion efficiency factor YidD [Thermodesulfobacteriota bacterium]